jgi:hypothetical protein
MSVKVKNHYKKYEKAGILDLTATPTTTNMKTFSRGDYSRLGSSVKSIKKSESVGKISVKRPILKTRPSSKLGL